MQLAREKGGLIQQGRQKVPLSMSRMLAEARW